MISRGLACFTVYGTANLPPTSDYIIMMSSKRKFNHPEMSTLYFTLFDMNLCDNAITDRPHMTCEGRFKTVLSGLFLSDNFISSKKWKKFYFFRVWSSDGCRVSSIYLDKLTCDCKRPAHFAIAFQKQVRARCMPNNNFLKTILPLR